MTSRDATLDESIKAGDLVMIVRPACCQNEFQGMPFIVQKLERLRRSCKICKAEYDGLFAYTGQENRPAKAPLYTLIKIDPPKATEDEKQKEDLREPA